MFLGKVIVSPLDNKNHKERYSLFLWKYYSDCTAVTYNNFDSYIGKIDLPPFEKKRGKWAAKVTPQSNGNLPLPCPDCELCVILVCCDKNVSSKFKIDLAFFE